MYLSLELIMKSEEPMVFSKLQGSSQNNNALEALSKVGTSKSVNKWI